jgi:hypothetical protein
LASVMLEHCDAHGLVGRGFALVVIGVLLPHQAGVVSGEPVNAPGADASDAPLGSRIRGDQPSL